MGTGPIAVDYLIIGTGAVGMAFADSLLAGSEATIAMVDRHHRPGGHWNDAYSFVRLHQPSSTYGVNSRPLGSGVRDEVGLNRGHFELASGHEVLSHFDLVMQQTFLPSGRVHYFPMSEVGDHRVVTSLVSGARREISAHKVVDATHSQMQVPSTHTPRYAVDPQIVCVPVNDLPRVAPSHTAFVVIGAGKTGMDACIWLLQNGADADNITWIMPRDSWLLNRANFQPSEQDFPRAAKSIADQVEAIVAAGSVDEVFANLEAFDEWRRIDPSVRPAAYHCAIISDDELAQLRAITNIVRLGRVTRIDPDRIVLDHGEVPTGPEVLHVDCSAAGIPTRPTTPIFAGERITPQWVRVCQPTFSAALLGHVETISADDDEKNRLCAPIAPPTVPSDWLRMMQVELANRYRWFTDDRISDWIAESRLDQFTTYARSMVGVHEDATAQMTRYLNAAGPAAAKLQQLLGA